MILYYNTMLTYYCITIACTAEYVENITVNVTMTKRPSSRQTGCVTASKVYQAQVSKWLPSAYCCALIACAVCVLDGFSSTTLYSPHHRGIHLNNQWNSHLKIFKAILFGFAIMI